MTDVKTNIAVYKKSFEVNTIENALGPNDIHNMVMLFLNIFTRSS